MAHLRSGAATVLRCRATLLPSALGKILQSYWPAQWGHVLQNLASPAAPLRHPLHCCSAAAQSSAGLCEAAASQAAGTTTFNLKVGKEDLSSGKGRLRLDAYLAAKLSAGNTASRAKVHTSIKGGLVTVNGRRCEKPSQALVKGDQVVCTLLPGPSLEAMPEAIPLDIAYEDDHLMVINKPPGMPVHISPGHHSGTLVNALLAHCGLPGVRIDPAYPSNLPGITGGAAAAAAGDHPPALSLEALGVGAGLGWVAASGDDSGGDEDEVEGPEVADVSGATSSGMQRDAAGGSGSTEGGFKQEEQAQESGSGQNLAGARGARTERAAVRSVGASGAPPGVLRPGIVHRLDKGTSGLLVVAKREAAQRALSAQFKARTVDRTYLSLTLGCPAALSGRVMTNIDRDPAERKRMAALPYGSAKGRTAASNYQVLERFGGGVAALVQWKLETGRTHQIRVHAKHMGHPLLADATYARGIASTAAAMSKGRNRLYPSIAAALEAFDRPALHARSLGFTHPATGRLISLECDLPPDMQQLLTFLRELPDSE